MKQSTQKKQTKQHTLSAYPDIVYKLEPLLQLSIYLLQVLRWKDDLRQHSLLCVLSWTFLCLHYYLFALTAPLWFILLLHYYDTTYKSKHKQQTTLLSYERVTTELRAIQIELDSYLHLDWFNRKSILKNKVWFGVLTMVLWLSCVAVFSLKYCVWFLGLLALSWKSPLFELSRHACHRVMLIFQQRTEAAPPSAYVHAPMKTIAPATTHSHRFFCFTVIEHQRWYPLRGWTCTLLPKDRPEWSDIYHERVPSIATFKLPAPTTVTVNNTEIKTTWKWTTDSWQDQSGWEYGSYDWSNWGSHSLNKLTRRRQWIRTASMDEDQQPANTIPMSRSNSLSTMTTASSFSSEYSLSSIDLIPSLSLQLQTKSIPTSMLNNKNHSEMLFSDLAL